MGPTAPRKRPTIRDVAAAAGVSRGTVSRVINGGHWVSPDSLAAVQEAIRTTGYSANLHARSLVTGRSNSVAFLLTEPQHLLFEDPNFSILLRGAARALAARGMPLLLMVAAPTRSRRRSRPTSAPGTSTASWRSPRTAATPCSTRWSGRASR